MPEYFSYLLPHKINVWYFPTNRSIQVWLPSTPILQSKHTIGKDPLSFKLYFSLKSKFRNKFLPSNKHPSLNRKILNLLSRALLHYTFTWPCFTPCVLRSTWNESATFTPPCPSSTKNDHKIDKDNNLPNFIQRGRSSSLNSPFHASTRPTKLVFWPRFHQTLLVFTFRFKFSDWNGSSAKLPYIPRKWRGGVSLKILISQSEKLERFKFDVIPQFLRSL